MKLLEIVDANNGHGRKIAVIGLNINELMLLRDTAIELGSKLPKVGVTSRLGGVCRQMSVEMTKAIKELEESGAKPAKLNYPEDEQAVI